MRITIRLSDDLHKEAKGIALESRTTLSQIIEDALRESLAQHRAVDPKRTIPRSDS